MPQRLLPLFPDGATCINDRLSFIRREGKITYFHGVLPVFVHDAEDLATFRMITAQFCVQGSAQQVEVVRGFGVTAISVKRAVQRYREKGPSGFYEERHTRGPAVLTPDVVRQVQRQLDEGQSTDQIARQMNLKPNTLDKAVRAGRLHRPQPVQRKDVGPRTLAADAGAASATTSSATPVSLVGHPPLLPTSKSERSTQDSQAVMGMGATNTVGRVAASLGLLNGVPIRFEAARDVSHGGVLLAVPALLASGLLRHTGQHFRLPPGYYDLPTLFLLLAFMGLCRVKSVEQLRYSAPGEWGRLLGLDRVPEVRTLREKIGLLGDQRQAALWNASLSQDWMQELPQQTATFCIDGHVRVYHGEQTALPRHYVARQKLCLRATADYWVNALDGRPFFLINQAVDPGLLKVLEQEIIPRLQKEAPHQPTSDELKANPLAHCFTVVFDREGYSPEFFKRMRQQQVACLTYHKYPGPDWPESEFREQRVRLSNGEELPMKLAERGVFLSRALWAREVRKLSVSGHQTSVLATDYLSETPQLAGAMFSRWSQENFFRYMRQHYALDRLVNYDVEAIPETTRMVNPEYRRLDGQVRSHTSKLHRKLAEFGALTLEGDLEPAKLEHYQHQKAELLEEIDQLKEKASELKRQRKDVPQHLTAAELPQEQRFQGLSTQSKHILDTIKMIAYRAETTLVHLARESLSRLDDARQLIASLFQTEADLQPDEQAGVLTVRIHHSANRASDEVVRHLCAELNATETTFPGTNLRLAYQLGAEQNP
jgi:hypothetical protein